MKILDLKMNESSKPVRGRMMINKTLCEGEILVRARYSKELFYYFRSSNGVASGANVHLTPEYQFCWNLMQIDGSHNDGCSGHDFYLEIFPGIYVGDVVVSTTSIPNGRKVGDMYQVLEISFYGCLCYTSSHSNSEKDNWRLATEDEKREYLAGKIKNISELKSAEPVVDSLVREAVKKYQFHVKISLRSPYNNMVYNVTPKCLKLGFDKDTVVLESPEAAGIYVYYKGVWADILTNNLQEAERRGFKVGVKMRFRSMYGSQIREGVIKTVFESSPNVIVKLNGGGSYWIMNEGKWSEILHISDKPVVEKALSTNDLIAEAKKRYPVGVKLRIKSAYDGNWYGGIIVAFDKGSLGIRSIHAVWSYDSGDGSGPIVYNDGKWAEYELEDRFSGSLSKPVWNPIIRDNDYILTKGAAIHKAILGEDDDVVMLRLVQQTTHGQHRVFPTDYAQNVQIPVTKKLLIN